jgi:pyruvate,orthophosphate dikinase
MSEVFQFGRGIRPARDASPELVGNKAWHLMRLAEAGLPVPPGFVLGTGWTKGEGTLESGARSRLRDVVVSEVRGLESRTGRTFGGGRQPLLLAVRSGAAASMPGMMDTVLDVGLGDATIGALRRASGNPRLCWDCYRRLVATFGESVLGVPAGRFERALAEAVEAAAVPDERELDAAQLEALARHELAIVEAETGQPFPQDPYEQLSRAIEAVFRSWMSPRAQAYRRRQGLPDAGGTAVTVQAMVFGNRGGDSGSGVGFTRDPATGAPGLYVDFLFDAQGEDVVSGRRSAFGAADLTRRLPDIGRELDRLASELERLFGDAQDFEFTVERGELWLLQSRAAKRTPLAALRIAVDLVREGRLTPLAALARLADVQLDDIAVERLAVPADEQPLARGVPASPGVVTGPLVLDADAAMRSAAPGILARPETSTQDLEGMTAAAGMVTVLGSRTSHAAVVARQLGRPCIVACRALKLDPVRRRAVLGDTQVDEGTVLTIDGTRGDVWLGARTAVRERPVELLAVVHGWRASLLHDETPESVGRPAGRTAVT